MTVPTTLSRDDKLHCLRRSGLTYGSTIRPGGQGHRPPRIGRSSDPITLNHFRWSAAMRKGTGKSNVIREQAALRYKAIDTDDGWCEHLSCGRQRWREDAIAGQGA